MKPVLRKALYLTVLLGGGMLVGLGVLELLTRVVVGHPTPERMPMVRVRADPDLGWSMLPNDRHFTYQIPVRLNRLGFRGPEVPVESAGEYRILALGDSHIYGQGVGYHHLLTTVAEARLNEGVAERPVRVVNLGVQDYSTNQELALLEKTGLSLDPDHVVLFFYINDFRMTDIDLRYERFREHDWYMFNISGKPEGWRIRKWKRIQLLRRSALLMWGNDFVRALRSDDTLEQRILRGDSDPDLEARREEVLTQLDGFVKRTREAGIGFTLAAIPAANQIATDFPDERYQSLLREFAEQNGVDYLDLLPALRSDHAATGRVPVIPFDGHYDSHGQSVMGVAVAEHLMGRVLRTDPRPELSARALR